MKISDRPLVKIKKDLRTIYSNKLSKDQSILMFMGITFEIILRKDLFKRNLDLKEFIEHIYIPKTEKKESFKNYLYFSRTLLASRINRLIFEEFNYAGIVDICKKIDATLFEEVQGAPKKGNSPSIQESAISEWMNFIDKKK